MSADFDEMARRSAAVAQLLTDADEAHLTCPRGTDLRLDLRGREGIPDDGDLTAPGIFGNLPCGEGFIAPAGGEGTIVARSAAMIGLYDEPLRVEVRDGCARRRRRTPSSWRCSTPTRPRAATSPSWASARTRTRR